MAKEMIFKKGRESCDAGAEKPIFILSVQTYCTVTEPGLDVIGREWQWNSGRAADGSESGDWIRELHKAEVRGCEGGGSSYVNGAAYRMAASRACGVRGPWL